MKQKNKFKINWTLLIGSIITISLGLVMVIFGSNDGIIYAIQALIGIVIVAVNGNNLYKLITKKKNDPNYKYRLGGYIVNVIIGLLLIFSPDETFRTIVLVFLIVLPILQIVLFGNVPGIIESSVLQIFLGIIVLILGVGGLLTIFFTVIGFILIIAGAFNLLGAFSVIKYKIK